ncbi:MAG: type II toxin-antitoxin system VapC family toxin [Chloroflexi bacterium]|nr:type II toxin-antitoxin system VapC family toxin [Chloroflexota bacterium]
MNAVYLDSSAFVKTVIAEPETSALRRFLVGQQATLVSSALLRTEALRAVRHLGPEALAQMRLALRRISLVGIDDRILDAAGVLDPAIVSTLDAIHLATAHAAGDDLTMLVTYDGRMTAGARLLGLPTASPA